MSFEVWQHSSGGNEMSRNVEVKARLRHRAAVESEAASRATEPPKKLEQRDSFYDARHGRLKLRRERDADRVRTVLVQYDREDDASVRLSSYSVVPIEPSVAETMHAALVAALGHVGDVVKTRYLYLVGQTRVHIDFIEALGDFIELEVVLSPDQTLEEGQKIANDLLQKFKISSDDFISGAYMDMILQANTA